MSTTAEALEDMASIRAAAEHLIAVYRTMDKRMRQLDDMVQTGQYDLEVAKANPFAVTVRAVFEAWDAFIAELAKRPGMVFILPNHRNDVPGDFLHARIDRHVALWGNVELRYINCPIAKDRIPIIELAYAVRDHS